MSARTKEKKITTPETGDIDKETPREMPRKKKIGITETALRDAHQSIMATRLRTEDMIPVAERMDEVGYHSLEVWGAQLSTPACASWTKTHGNVSAH